jgi:hypothetical protein
MDGHARPAWWQCYLIGLLMIGLLVFDYWLPVSDGAHKILAVGILCGCFRVISWWMRANRAALIDEEREAHDDRPPAPRRDVPLTPVQEHYLRIMQRERRT